MSAPTAYEPPVALEGENIGLIEAVAARLWAFRSTMFSNRVSTHDFGAQSYQVRQAWRRTAIDLLEMMLGEMGFQGPAGPPRSPITGWSYAWHEEVGQWEIIDDNGGLVALVGYQQDVSVIMNAPLMAQRIRELLTAIEGTPAAEHPQIQALAESLPRPPTKLAAPIDPKAQKETPQA